MENNDLRSYNILRKLKIISILNAMLLFKDNGYKGILRKLKEKKQNQCNKLSINNKMEFKKQHISIVFDYNVPIKEKKFHNKNIQIFKLMKNKSKITNNISISNEDFNNYFYNRSFIFVTNKNGKKCFFPYSITINYGVDIDNTIEKILATIIGLKLIANYDNDKNITVKASTFYNYEGSNYFSGGAERYLIDLHQVCKQLGYNLDIYQNASKNFFRKYNNINVIGLKVRDNEIDYRSLYLAKQTKNYIYQTQNKSQLHIYSAFYECYP